MVLRKLPAALRGVYVLRGVTGLVGDLASASGLWLPNMENLLSMAGTGGVSSSHGLLLRHQFLMERLERRELTLDMLVLRDLADFVDTAIDALFATELLLRLCTPMLLVRLSTAVTTAPL